MASSLRSPPSWTADDMDGDHPSDGDAGSFTEGSSDSSSDESDLEFESMTAKGIKRLCSELLELKKASDEDFQKNVSSNLSVFVRIFKEVGGVEIELTKLKHNILVQKKLVKDLTGNLYSEVVSNDPEDIKAKEPEDLDSSSPSRFAVDRNNILETVDILLTEHRIEEALILLEAETETLQKLQMEEEQLLPVVMSYMSEISDRRVRLADQFASLAGHPRVSQLELQSALSGLCRLGESSRANVLLIRFYRSHLERRMSELESSIPFLHGRYIIELSKVVFSAISQALQRFGLLYGEATPYASELIRWIGEEMETFSHSFDKYVKFLSETSEGLSLAVEAANTAISFCALLESQKMGLQPYLTKLIRPCMEEVLMMHIDHFKKVVSVFATTDTWVLSRVPISGILRDKSSLTGMGGEVEYCPLTSSGRKFVSLMEAIVDDIKLLVKLQMENSILKGLADLFNEYMCTLEKAIPNRGHLVENGLLRISPAHKLQQQICLLVNSSTLVYFFPTIAGTILKGTEPSNTGLFLEHTGLSSPNELDTHMLSILEAADRLRGCFCQQVVYEVMSGGDCYVNTGLKPDIRGHCILSSPEMPSLAFQALFLRLRELELSKSIFAGEDEIVKMLLEELMETVIVWLSNNQDFWERSNDYSFTPQYSCLEQVYIDMHFLLEIAKLGGYFSDDLMVAASELIAQIGAKFYPNSDEPDEEWASKAAKLAMEKLLEIEVANSERRDESASSFKEDFGTQYLDGDNITKLFGAKNIQMKPLQGNVETTFSDEDGLRNPTLRIVTMEDGQGATGADSDTGMNSSIEYSAEPTDNSQDTVEKEILVAEAKYQIISHKLHPTEALEVADPALETKFMEIDDNPDFHLENNPAMLLNGDTSSEENGGSDADHVDTESKLRMLRIADASESTDKSTGSSHIAQDDSPRVSEEWTTDEGRSFEEEPLAGRGNRVVHKKGGERKVGVRASRAGSSRRSTSRSIVLWSSGARPKPAEDSEKNRKRVTRPKWH